MTSNPLNKVLNILRNLKEDAPTNSLGGGQISGTVEAGDDPRVNKKKKKRKR